MRGCQMAIRKLSKKSTRKGKQVKRNSKKPENKLHLLIAHLFDAAAYITLITGAVYVFSSLTG